MQDDLFFQINIYQRLCSVMEMELALLLFITISQKNQYQDILTL
jgi:hypothetical protein